MADKVYLLQVKGDFNKILDSVYINQDNTAAFKLGAELEPGLYRFAISPEQTFDFIYNYENVVLSLSNKNGTVDAGLEAVRTLKLTTDVGAWVCQGEIELSTDDSISLVVKSDKVGAVLTFYTTQANIFPPTHIIE